VVVKAFDVGIRLFVLATLSMISVALIGVLTDPFLLTVGGLLLTFILLAVGPVRRWVFRGKIRRSPERTP
jgi:hypothetical protein